MERRAKVTSLEAALDQIPSGASIAFGGFALANKPMAFVRALIRAGRAGLTVIGAPQASLEIDLLLGAGALDELWASNVAFDYLGLAPFFRRAGETDAGVRIVDTDEATLMAGLKATAENLPFHPVTSLKGTDFLSLTPLVREWTAPDGTVVLAVPPIRPDVAVLHAQEADEYGNVRHLGATFADLAIAKAAGRVIVTVDRIVDHQSVRLEPHRTSLAAYFVDAVVETPAGAHPCSSHGLYQEDTAHLRDYLTIAQQAVRGDRAGFEGYLDRYVRVPAAPEEYYLTIGGADRLRELLP